MLLSLIVTTYRRPELLARALRSVSVQLEAALEIELIVSDDDPEGSGRQGVRASGIASVEGLRLELLCRQDGPGGVAASRNRAIAASRGDWLMFLDDDDTLREGALRALLAQARETGADFVCGRHVYAHEQVGVGVFREVEPQHHWTDLDGLLVRNVLPMGAFIMRRDAARVPFNTRMRTHEDWLFLLDNLVGVHPGPRIASIDRVVLRVHQALDGSRDHRNVDSGLRQRATDFVRIYAMHPAPHLGLERRNRLEQLPTVDLDTLISGEVADPGPVLARIPPGRFLVEAGKPILREGLPEFDEPLIEAIRLALIGMRLRPGRLIEVGAGRGAFTIPVAQRFPDCALLAIEAALQPFMHLCANVVANMLGNVEPHRACVGAVGDEPHIARPAMTLDRLLGADRQPVALLRVAARAALRDLLQGATGLLREHRPVLLFPRAEASSDGSARWLTRRGYRLLPFEHNVLALHPGEPSSAGLARAYAERRVGRGVGSSPPAS